MEEREIQIGDRARVVRGRCKGFEGVVLAAHLMYGTQGARDRRVLMLREISSVESSRRSLIRWIDAARLERVAQSDLQRASAQ